MKTKQMWRIKCYYLSENNENFFENKRNRFSLFTVC